MQLKTTTTVATSRSFPEDRIWLNGKEEDITHPRLQSCLRESELKHVQQFNFKMQNRSNFLFYCVCVCVCFCVVRRLARKRRSDGDTELDSIGLSHKVHICSVNNFPTAAGLASSAAGFACLGES